MKKRIPFWSSVSVQHDIHAPIVAMFPVSDSLLVVNTQQSSYVLTITNKQVSSTLLPLRVQHCLTAYAPTHQAQIRLLALNLHKHRYELYAYDTVKFESKKIKCDGLTPKEKGCWTATIATDMSSTKREELIWVIGGSAKNGYEIAATKYFWNIEKCISGKLPDTTNDDHILRELLDAKNSDGTLKNLIWAFEEVVFILVKQPTTQQPFYFDELVIYSILQCKFIGRIQSSFRFKYHPCFTLDSKTQELYILDSTTIYRISMDDYRVQKLNRGIFLWNPPSSILYATKYQSFLVIYSTSQQSSITKSHIFINDLQVLQSPTANNIPLSFYFNKPLYSDLVFSIEDKQINCSRHLFQHYSLKFKKIFIQQKPLNSSASMSMSSTAPSSLSFHHPNNSVSISSSVSSKPISIKLEMRFATFYFLVQQMYSQFKAQQLNTFDEETLLELLLLANKFQISEFQKRCEDAIAVYPHNFEQLYDFYRSSDTYAIRDKLFRYFVSNYKEIAKTVPVGKVEEIIRCLYTPQCQHNYGTIVVASPQQTRLQTTRKDKHNRVVGSGSTTNGPATVQICEKCSKVLNLNKL